MKEIFFKGIDDLAAGIGIYLALGLAAAILQIVFGGWKGVRHALSILLCALFFAVMAGWACQYYQLPWAATAAIICGATLLSNAIMSIVFHPAIRDAIVKRAVAEIESRGFGGKEHGSEHKEHQED